MKKILPAAFWSLLVMPQLLGAPNVISLSKPVSESIKPDGLYWTFDGGTLNEAFPLVVEDVSGNGYEGQLQAGAVHPEPIYVEGKFGMGLRFPGPTPKLVSPEGKEVTQPNPSVRWMLSQTSGAWDETKLDMNGKSFTAGLWIKLDSVMDGERQSIFLMNRGVMPSQWGFTLIKDERDGWGMQAVGLAKPSEEKSQALNDGRWHHVAFSVEEKEGGSYVSYWLDGQLLGQPVVASSQIGIPTSDAQRTFTLGERNVANFTTGFDGVVDDVFVTSGTVSFEP